MKTIIYIIAIIAVTLIGTFYLPWWVIPIVVSLISYFQNSTAFKSFLIALLTTSMIWFLLTVIKDSSHVNKVALLTGEILLGLSPSAIYVITGLILGLVSGLAALVGGRIRQDFSK